MADKVQLYCFPYGGAGSSMYRSWGSSLPAWVEVRPVHFPGREHRIREAPHSRLAPLLDEVLAGFHPAGPFALFGHSMGALVVFELARALRRQGRRLPGLAIVSGLGAPQLGRDRPRIADLPPGPFLEELRAHFDVTEDLLAEPALLDFILPVLRADLATVENYTYTPEPPFDFPLAAFGGEADPEVPPSGIEGWKAQSSRPVEVTTFPGGHFYINTYRNDVLAAVRRALEQAFA